MNLKHLKAWLLIFFVSLVGCASGNKRIEKMEQPECRDIENFFTFLKISSQADIKVVEQKAEELFPDEKIENRNGLFVLIEFQQPRNCFNKIKNWGEPFEQYAPPSPPPLQPGSKPLNLNPNDNPYIWSSSNFKKFGRTIGIGHDSNRIKTIRIDQVDSPLSGKTKIH